MRAIVLLAAVMLSIAGASPVDGQGLADSFEAAGSILRVERTSADDGWVLTDRALLVTRDGGASWSNLTRGQSLAGMTDASVLPGERAWLAGISSAAPGELVVDETADGGMSWRKRVIAASDLAPGRAYVRARTQFIDADHGWFLGQVATSSAFSVGELLRTSDGGMNWNRLPRPPGAGRFIFIDASHGYMTGAPVSERLYRSVDGGWSWRQVDLPVAAEPGVVLFDLPIFHSPERGAVAITVRDESPRVISFATLDGGVTWLQVDSAPLPPGGYDEPVPTELDRDGRILAVAGVGKFAFEKTISVRRLFFAEVAPAWAFIAEGSCDGGACRQVTRLVLVKPVGEAPDDLLVRVREALQPEKGSPVPTKAGVISFAHGFDKCAAGTAEQMQTWWDQSPHAIANIYFGGAARACSQVNLDTEWVAEVFAQGWRLIPTWVGPQAPCTNYIRRISADPVEARLDGVAEADAAVAAAAALGLGEGTPLYYDVEYYDEFDQSCSEAMREFIDAWSKRVQGRGYLAGAYGNARNVQNDWIPGVVANPLQAVWLVPWVCGRTSSCDWTLSVFGVPGLDDSYWADYQRIRQYWGPHTETYGGVTFEIDSDYASGPVAAESASASCWQIVPSERWRGEYYGGTDLSGQPLMVRDDGDGALDFGWGEGTPSSECGVPSDEFSVRWRRTVHLEAGTYRFTLTGDDGVRLSIDGVVQIDEWRRQGPTTFTATVELDAGDHTLQLDYFEGGGGATAELSWKPLSRSRRAGGRRIPS